MTTNKYTKNCEIKALRLGTLSVSFESMAKFICSPWYKLFKECSPKNSLKDVEHAHVILTLLKDATGEFMRITFYARGGFLGIKETTIQKTISEEERKEFVKYFDEKLDFYKKEIENCFYGSIPECYNGNRYCFEGKNSHSPFDLTVDFRSKKIWLSYTDPELICRGNYGEIHKEDDSVLIQELKEVCDRKMKEFD